MRTALLAATRVGLRTRPITRRHLPTTACTSHHYHHHHPRLLSSTRQTPAIAVEDLGCSSGGLTARQQADIEELVLDRLRTVIDTTSLKDVVTLGCVQRLTVDQPDSVLDLDKTESPGARVTFKLVMPQHLQGHTEQYADLKKRFFEALHDAPELRGVNIRVLADKTKKPATREQSSTVPPADKAAAEQQQKESQPVQPDLHFQSPGLKHVTNVIAVHSCKGGVGKSTVAVNLAWSLSKHGARVGIFDADIHGPSLPLMVVPPGHKRSPPLSVDGTTMMPVLCHGLQCMSYGFIADKGEDSIEYIQNSNNSNNGPSLKPAHGKVVNGLNPSANSKKNHSAAVMRGPMVSNVVKQLINNTRWGELDYLVLDLPPGTGDIHLTLLQNVKVRGAVLVTTPQRLSYADVVKGLEMFDKMKVPTMAVVENMAWFVGDDGKRYFPFGAGHRERLQKDFGIRSAFSLPISEETSIAGDGGIPISQSAPHSETAIVFDELAQDIAAQVFESQTVLPTTTSVQYHAASDMLVCRQFTEESAREFRIPPAVLRAKMNTVEDMLNKATPSPDDNVVPLRIEPRGNYAVSIAWSDGHDASIYPFSDLIAAAREYHIEQEKSKCDK